MYLSRLILNPRDRDAQRDLANVYELHRTLMSAFPEDLPDRERVLFRVEPDLATGIPTVLVQSHIEPDWQGLSAREDYLLPASQWPPSVFANPALKPFTLALTPGQRLAFRLRANPTVKRDGSRHGLYREDEQRDWLDRKGHQAGFEVLQLRTVQEGNTYARIPRKRGDGRRRATFFAVCFDGLLRVRDPDRLWESVQDGIGPAKGFGFGLLSLAPAR
jgi:CRISPR system Cascade subunit CasE